MRPIREEERILWDVLIMVTILFVVFEVPFDLLVGWTNQEAKIWADRMVLYIFLADIVLNCFTVQTETFSGFWGWRNIAGLISEKYSPRLRPDYQEDFQVSTQPQMLLTYLASGWFLIDLLAVFPFDLLFQGLSFFSMSRTLRLARLARLLRLVRALRAIKAFRLFTVMENVLGRRPAVLRFIILGIFVVWAAHVHACVFYYFEKTNLTSPIHTYGQALHYVFITFTTADLAEVVTPYGYWASVSSVVFGVTFFGMFIGNFSTYFAELDQEKAMIEERRQQWTSLFKAYPQVFTLDLRKRVLDSVRRSHAHDRSAEARARLIASLDSELEGEVKVRLVKLREERPSRQLNRLIDHLTRGEVGSNGEEIENG